MSVNADSPTSPQGPLRGITVLELGSRIASVFASGILAEQGATVIEVEDPSGGDVLRPLTPSMAHSHSSSRPRTEIARASPSICAIPPARSSFANSPVGPTFFVRTFVPAPWNDGTSVPPT